MKIQMKRSLAGMCCALACTGLLALPQVATAQVGAGSASAQASKDLPDAKKIIDHALAAMGGEEAFKKIKTHDIEFEMEAGPQVLACAVKSMTKDKKNMFNAEMQVMGMVIKMGSDGDTHWQTNPMNGQYSIMDGAQAEQMAGITELGTMQTMIGDIKEEAAILETVDKTEFEGRSCYKVRAVPKDDETGEPKNSESMFMYFDAEKHLPMGMESSENGMTVKMVFKEWKETAGVKVPTLIEGSQGPQAMKLTFKKFEFNTLKAAAFELPAEVKALKGDGGGSTTTKPGR